jgi:glycosyltransferase involved in cell wall biosynthesis
MLDKKQCRSQLGLPQDGFIIAFVGWFIERKGPLRVAKAIKQIPGKPVYSLFIGKGEQVPDCENILFKGTMPHDKVPIYLNAADVFVLPTLHEGCCNAVVEAMACGLPIISSDLPFNRDVLDSSNSILIDPNCIDEISQAICLLRDDLKLRSVLAEGALKRSELLTIDRRARAIVEFINEKIKTF